MTSVKWNPIPFESDQSSCYDIVKSGPGEDMTSYNVYPTILEIDKIYVLVGHEKHALCDSYIVNFVHDATENYYERGKYGRRNLHVIKIPLFMLEVLNCSYFTFLCLLLCASLVYLFTRSLCIGSG